METVVSNKALWAGRILTWLPSLFILWGGVNMLLQVPMVVEGMKMFGFPAGSNVVIGTAGLLASLLTLIPKTEILGGLLFIGYLGGAVATHVHAGQPFLAPIFVGVVVWVGLWLKEPRVRQLLPIKA